MDTELQYINRMVAPSQHRPHIYLNGILQIHITRACDKACFNCTQGSNLGGKPVMMTVEQFEQACISLKDYFGVVGVFGGNPAMHPDFETMCLIMQKYIPFPRRGLWCNHPRGKGKMMRQTFNPRHSNINVHMDKEAKAEFARDWPEAHAFGLEHDSRHSPPWVAMKDVIEDEQKRMELISNCDINRNWSALIGIFRGQLRAWFCEIAGAQSMLHANDPNYPDTGLDPTVLYNADGTPGGSLQWWQLKMPVFANQVRKHCHECGVPLKGFGEMAVTNPNGVEQVSKTHADIYKPKDRQRQVQVVDQLVQLGETLHCMTDYVGNAVRPEKEILQK